jgi:hypothetical protein
MLCNISQTVHVPTPVSLATPAISFEVTVKERVGVKKSTKEDRKQERKKYENGRKQRRMKEKENK